MKMKIIRKTTILSSCALILAGCAKTSIDSETLDETISLEKSEAQTEIDSLTESASESAEETEMNRDWPTSKKQIEEKYPDKTVLTWVYSDFNYIAPALSSAVNEYLNETGASYVIYFDEVTEDGFEDEINRRIAAGEAPDIISQHIGYGGYASGMTRALKNDWVLQIDDYLQTEEGQKLWESIPEKYWELCSYYGHYYGYSTHMIASSDTYAYYVNTALMEKYGISEEELAETDLADMDDIFAEVYEGENGNVNILKFSSDSALRVNTSGMFSTLVDSCNVQSDAFVFNLRTEEREIVNLFEDEDAVAYFTALSEYNQAGYFDDGGDTFLIPSYNYLYGEGDVSYKNFGGEDNVTIIERSGKELSQQIYSMITVCKASEYQAEALSAITVTATDIELSTMLLNGVEGIDYTIEDGKVTDIFDYSEDKSSVGIVYPSFGNFFNCTALSDEPWNTEDRTAVLFEMVENAPLSEQRNCVIYLKEFETQVDEIQSIVQDYKTGLYAGTYEDVPAVLEELNERLRAAGIDEVLEEANRQLNADELPAALLE